MNFFRTTDTTDTTDTTIWKPGFKLKLRTDDGDGKEDRWECAYLMSKNNVYCTRYMPRTCVSLHFDIYV